MARYQERDERKNKIAAHRGITIINVPFWWDWNAERYERDKQGRGEWKKGGGRGGGRVEGAEEQIFIIIFSIFL